MLVWYFNENRNISVLSKKVVKLEKKFNLSLKYIDMGGKIVILNRTLVRINSFLPQRNPSFIMENVD